ncbi:MAG: hypothetical protein AB1782_19200 [Cyanobacteriota bacterium]
MNLKTKNKSILIISLLTFLFLTNQIFAQTKTDLPVLDYLSEGTKNESLTDNEAPKIEPTESGQEEIEIKEEIPPEKELKTDHQKKKKTKHKKSTKKDEEEKENKTLSASAVVIKVDSDKLEYIQDQDMFVATGNAKVVVEGQNAILTANKVIYYQSGEYITAEGNLQITKDDKVINGDYARVELDKESALINNPNTVIERVRMEAKEAVLYPELIELNDGAAILEQEKLDLSLTAGVYKPEEIKKNMPGYRTVIPANPQNKPPKYKIVAREIELDRAKKTQNLIVKDAKIYIGRFKLARLPRMTLTIGDESKIVEAMLPEVGFDKNIAGIYFGPSLTLDLPKNSMLRISPVFSAAGRKHVVGGGGIARFRSPINNTDIGYTSTADRLVVKGEQKIFRDTTKIKYYVNEYPETGFMGMGFYRPLYLAELVDERKVVTALKHTLSTRISGGIARDVDYGITTPRVQVQANLMSDEPILSLKDYIKLRLQTQVNFAAYGTGNTYTILRGGPRIDWNLWRLSLNTSYFQAGIWGHTPFVFDEFIRGTSNLLLAGDFKICKYLSIGNIRSMNLSKNGPEPRLMTENQFYARVGPEDFKFRIGYDISRKRSLFGIDLFLGSGRSAFNFDKMKILNPDVELK